MVSGIQNFCRLLTIPIVLIEKPAKKTEQENETHLDLGICETMW